jgi:hypothetical protein
LLTGQQIERLEAGLLMAVMFPLQPVLEIIRMVSNPRYVTGGTFLGTRASPLVHSCMSTGEGAVPAALRDGA